LPFLQKAKAIAPNSTLANDKLGRALFEAGKPLEAVPVLQWAASLDPENPKVHFDLARAYRAAGQQEKARGEFEICKSLYGHHGRE
jgi:Flp pilus assembly protein TadD